MTVGYNVVVARDKHICDEKTIEIFGGKKNSGACDGF